MQQRQKVKVGKEITCESPNKTRLLIQYSGWEDWDPQNAFLLVAVEF